MFLLFFYSYFLVYSVLILASLFVIVAVLAIAGNVLRLADVADLKAQNCQAETKIINCTHFKLLRHPQYSASRCYHLCCFVVCVVSVHEWRFCLLFLLCVGAFLKIYFCRCAGWARSFAFAYSIKNKKRQMQMCVPIGGIFIGEMLSSEDLQIVSEDLQMTF